MDIIHLLPDVVANQIAAGEVVQRPANVIKELMENSIDAGATKVQIVLREAGRDLIQVIDNGKGMSPTDARMAFEKHATSKIQKADDLFNLYTMGFRGEALASVAAVAEVELRTRRPDDEAGVLIAIAGSKVQRQEACACPSGANFMVRNLFFNVPARRKFLKSNQTELSNIMQEIQHVALSNPTVEVSVMHNEQLLMQLSSGSLKQRIVQLFGKNLAQQLLPIALENDLMNISGFVGTPEGARKKGALQYFFVNDRFMRHPFFHRAVMDCFQNLIPEGSQPNYFIFLQVDPKSIDVNINPTKTEIKFENESARWHILQATVREALGKFNALPAIDFDQADAPEIDSPRYNDPTAVTSQDLKPRFEDFNPFRQQRPDHWESLYQDFRNESLPSRMDRGDSSQHQDDTASAGQSLSSRLDSQDLWGEADQELPSAIGTMPDAETQASLVAPSAAQRRNLFMQVGGRYIVGNARGGMMLIDQHRAHLCLLYDRYYQQICQREGFSQGELFPECVTFAPADEPYLQSILPTLGYLGFEIDSLGNGSYAIQGKPASLERSVNIQDLLLQLIEVAREGVRGISEELDKKLALRLAKMQAIPYGRQLGEEEMHQLVENLLALPEHQLTPDGHKVMTLVGNDALSALL